MPARSPHAHWRAHARRSYGVRLVEVGELVGIGVLDHVIIAKRGVTSFRARQLL